MLMAMNAVICSRCLVTEPWVRSFIFAAVFWLCYNAFMSVQVYGCNHIAIEVDDVKAAVKFYRDVFNLEKMNDGEGDAFLKLGEHQFLATFEFERVKPARARHFGLIVRAGNRLTEVGRKVIEKSGLNLDPPFRGILRAPWGNAIQ